MRMNLKREAFLDLKNSIQQCSDEEKSRKEIKVIEIENYPRQIAKLQICATATPAIKLGVLSKAKMTAQRPKVQMMKIRVEMIHKRMINLFSFLAA